MSRFKRCSMLATAFAASLAVLTVSDIALADPPPETLCGAGCEFLVEDFIGRYPDNAERAAGKWQCWDEIAKSSIACTFIRGKDIEKFSHVYRKNEAVGGGIDSCFANCMISGSDMFNSPCASSCRLRFNR